MDLPLDEHLSLIAASRLERGMLAFLSGELPRAGQNLIDGLEGAAVVLLPDGRSDAEGALSFSAYLLGAPRACA